MALFKFMILLAICGITLGWPVPHEAPETNLPSYAPHQGDAGKSTESLLEATKSLDKLVNSLQRLTSLEKTLPQDVDLTLICKACIGNPYGYGWGPRPTAAGYPGAGFIQGKEHGYRYPYPMGRTPRDASRGNKRKNLPTAIITSAFSGRKKRSAHFGYWLYPEEYYFGPGGREEWLKKWHGIKEETDQLSVPLDFVPPIISRPYLPLTGHIYPTDSMDHIYSTYSYTYPKKPKTFLC